MALIYLHALLDPIIQLGLDLSKRRRTGAAATATVFLSRFRGNRRTTSREPALCIPTTALQLNIAQFPCSVWIFHAIHHRSVRDIIESPINFLCQSIQADVPLA
jgi:hypothetical protein